MITMKNIFSLLLFSISLSANAQQKLLTIQEAMSGTKLPENLRQLQFVKGTDDYIYLKRISG